MRASGEAVTGTMDQSDTTPAFVVAERGDSADAWIEAAVDVLAQCEINSLSSGLFDTARGAL